MHSSHIAMLAKARRYAKEPDRLRFVSAEVELTGDNGRHRVTLRDGTWSCDCDRHGVVGECAHALALERFLGGTARAEPVLSA